MLCAAVVNLPLVNDTAGSVSLPVKSLMLGSALISVLALFWRRRYPVAVTLLALVAAAFGLSAALPVALFSLALHRPPDRTLAVLAVASILPEPLAWWLVPTLSPWPSAYWGVNLALEAALTALLVGGGILMRRTRARRSPRPSPAPGMRGLATRATPRARDVSLMGLALVVDGSSVVTLSSNGYSIPEDLLLLLALASAATLWWRRQHPVALTVLGVLLVLVHLGGVVTIGLLTLSIRRRDRVLFALATASVVAAIVAALPHGDVGQIIVTTFVTALGTGAVVAFGAYIGARRDLVESLRERADRAEAERELRADQARLGERTRIAGEMHDVLAHKVSLIALHAGGLEVQSECDVEQVQRTAALIRTTAREALEDLRDVLGVLRAEGAARAELAPQPDIDQVERLVEASRAAGVAIEMVLNVVGEPPQAVGRTAHRVIQESLTNVHKHARSASTVVNLSGASGIGLEIEVLNQVPVALDTLLPGAGMGLVGLAERVSLLGGVLKYGPTPSGGWLVQAHLPWAEQGDTE